ncbi:MAG: hypothetical protein J5I90_15780, partial [Caldilineales bacterium]|nr:hypothetical protein [Caldilineales bacterium]
MSNKRVTRLAWAWCFATIVTGVAAFFFWHTVQSANYSVAKTTESVITLAGFITFAITGALIISRQPRNRVGWLLMLMGSLAFVWPLDSYYNNLSVLPTHPSIWFMLGLWVWSWLWVWLIFPILFIPLFFPTGQPPSPRWRWVVVLGLGLCFFFIFFVTFSTEWIAQDDSWRITNPIGFLTLEFPIVAWGILLLSFAALSVISLFVRYRRAQMIEREQMKWLLYAAALFFLIYSTNFLTSNQEGIISEISGIILFLGIFAIPIAIAVAILRYRLYDIDIIIRKTLQYGVLTALLALVYFGLIVLLQTLFGRATGEQNPVIIVVSTLAIAALFTPLRRRVQDV